MNEYATLAQFRAFKSVKSDSTDDDDIILRYLGWASRQIDKYCKGRKFYPMIATYEFDYQRGSWKHYFDRDLLELTTLTVDDTEIAAANYRLYPLNDYPKYKVELLLNQSNVFTYSSTPQATVDVAGVWGYHDDWDNAFLDSGDTVQDDGGINASVTSVTFTDIDGADVDSFTPRASAGDMLKIGSEYLQVTATNTTPNVATVRRGVNGSTAASHNNGVTISVYKPATVATMACLGLTKFIYETRDQYGGIIALPSLDGTVIEVEVKRVLRQYELPIRHSDLMNMTWQ